MNMFIELLVQKMKFVLMMVLVMIGGCIFICGFIVWCCILFVMKECEQIYILDGDIFFLVQCVWLEVNFMMEVKVYIQFFYQYFFNLFFDNDYIKWMVGKVMYMVDGMVFKQKQVLDENGFYFDIIFFLVVCIIMCDFIQFDEYEWKFIYYGMQFIKC